MNTKTTERREILNRARAVRTRTKHRRWAIEMRDAGWKVDEPPACVCDWDPQSGHEAGCLLSTT